MHLLLRRLALYYILYFRLMKAYGTINIDDPLTYRFNVFLLLGQKPM